MSPETDNRQLRLAEITARLKEISRERYGCNAEPELLTDKGLAHDHFRLPGTGTLFRVPKQSQMDLSPHDNLAYQAACFSRASVSGAAPALHDLVEPDERLPFGALLVDRIDGRPAKLPEDLAAIAACLAAIHSLPVPGTMSPLADRRDTITAILAEIEAQAEALPHPAIDEESRSMIRAEIAACRKDAGRNAEAVCLITFDAHPGNYIIRPDGSAVIVDLEKMRYAAPGFDLAHATLYTSTTWDIESSAELSPDDTASFYRHWLECVPEDLAEKARPTLLSERRAMWLWSVTWCARWLSESLGDRIEGATRNWSRSLSDDALTRHVAGRVEDYLAPSTIARVRADWSTENGLTALHGRL